MKSIVLTITCRNNEPFWIHQDGATNLTCRDMGRYLRYTPGPAGGHENSIVNPESWLAVRS